MKRILPYLLLFTGVPALAQKTTNVKINITIDTIRQNNIRLSRPDSIRFYKLPGNNLAFTVPPEKIEETFELKDIPVGKYRVTYRNIYMESSTRQITLLENSLNEVSICVDSLDNYPQHTLTKLQDKDSISLNYRSPSCDGFTESDIIITRDRDHFVARMYWSFSKIRMVDEKLQFKEDTVFRSVVLTDQQIKAFVRFENELRRIKPYKEENGVEHVCTTTDSYSVKSKYFNIEKSDHACRWDGFGWLRTALFGRLY